MARWWATALSALLCILLTLSPVSALTVKTDVKSLTDLAEWAGCENVIVRDISSSYMDFNAYFGVESGEGRPYIVLINGESVPEQHRFMIFLHELGHCLQYMEGVILQMASETRELDADGRAAQLACALHMDGPRMLDELWDWAYETFGYDGDPDHGTLEQRREQANRAKSYCPNYQAPFQTTLEIR